MFATQEFRSMLQEKLTEAVSAYGLDGYKAEMKDYLIPVDVPAFASEPTDERPSQRP